MGLSSDLISQFVKITKDKETSKSESTTYGTIVKYNGKTYAKLDGSELLTPVTTTTDVEENERVTVTIKNHTATVTGNISSPSARTDTVKEIDKEVTVIGNKISEFEIVIADKVSTTELDAEKARIDTLVADNVTIKEKLTAAEADIGTLEVDNVTVKEKLAAAEADIDTLVADNVTINGKMTAAEADIDKLEADYIMVSGTVSANEANIKNLTADNVTIKEKVSASEAEITNIKAANVTLSGKVSANEADIDKLTTDYAVVNEKLIANSASIDILEADYATINGKMTVAEADISTLEADNVNINSKLNANEADINNLKANSLTADSAVIKNLQSDVADIDTLIFGSASGNSIQTSFANAVIAQLGNAQIKSAMIESVSASKITAGDIVTNNVRVMSEDGSLIISDETLQISDGARVRVQIGKDASNDYSINIWDASGNLMFSKGGITDAAIKDAIIRNDMVAANANISASKLDIDSLFTEINNSTKTIKSTKVYLDEKGQTLDAAFTSMTTDVNGIRGTVESQGTQISVMQGQIANKIWQTDIDTTIDKLEIGGRNLLRFTSDLPIGTAAPPESASGYSTFPGSMSNLSTTENGLKLIRSATVDSVSIWAPITSLGCIDNDEVITLSFDYRTNTSDAGKLYFMQSSGYNISTSMPALTISENEWKHYEWTLSHPEANIRTLKSLLLFYGVTSSTDWIEVKKGSLKLEKGNRATDWTPAPEDVDGEISTLNTKYSEVKQTVDGLSTTVAAHTTQISNKADSSTVTTVSNKVTSLEQNLDGFKTTVSNTYATKTALNTTNSNVSTAQSTADKAVTDAANAQSDIDDLNVEVTTLSDNHSSLEQTVDSISATVASHTTEISNKADSSTVTTVSSKVSDLELGLNGFKTTVSNTYTTKTDFDSRMSEAETAIDQNAEAIALRATKTEVSQTLSGYYTKTQTDAAIETKADSITSSVSSTYATKSALNETSSKLPWQSQGWVDASAYDESLWIPFVSTESLPIYGYGHIAVTVALNSGTKPSWSSHSAGFSVEFDVEAKSSGWGTSIQEAIINRDTYNHCTASPVSYKQLGYGSKAVLYLRGGGKYYVYTSWATTWTGFPDGYTWTSGEYSQSAPTSTTRPTPEGYMYGTKTEIKQLSDRITANVTDISSLGTRMSSVEQTAEGLTVSLSNTQTELDNLEVGGRNYIVLGELTSYTPYNSTPTHSNKVISTTLASTVRYFTLASRYTPPNDVMTISGYIKVNDAIPASKLFTSLASTYGSGLQHNDYDPTTGYFRITQTYPGNNNYIFHGQMASYTAVGDIITLDRLKFEKGNRATDWTPAPEDVDISISNAQTTANTAVTNAANAQSTANTASSKADTAQSTANTANSTANSVKTDLANNYTKKTLPDTRNDNQNPQWYMTNYPRQIITEFKYSSVIGLSGETYCSLTTTVPWTDSSGGYPKQHAKVGSKEYWRVGTSTTAWGSWVDAYGTAQNAAKTATNYLNFSNGGLVVGNMTASTLGNNVLIDTDSVDIRNGTTVLASYKADTIELGKNSPQSIIDLCDGTAQLTNKNTVSGTDWYRLGITSRDEIGLETSGQVAMDTYYETASDESASGVFRLSSSNPWVDQLGVVPMAYISVDHRTSDVQKRSEFSLADDYAGITQTYSATDVDRITIFDVVANSTKSAVEMTTDRLEMLRNNSKIYGVSPNGVKKAVFIPQNQYGNTIIGYDNYTNGSGNTNVYGQDISIASSEAGNVSYRPYYRGNGLESSGDTITMKIRTAGFVTSSGQSIQFTVPLAKPIIGNPTVTATSVDGFQLRCNGLYTHGSSASAYAKPDSYSVVTTNGGNNVVITASFSTTTNIINNTVTVGARNNSAIGIYWSGQLTITFG